MIDLRRSLPVFDPDKCPPIVMIGCGATGSKVFEHLVCLGVKEIHCFDDDVVEEHNLGNQLYLRRDLGQHKILGLSRWAIDKVGADAVNNYHYNPRRIHTRDMQELLNNLDRPAIVLNLVDSMSARTDIAAALWEHPNCISMLETRIAGTYGFVYHVNTFDGEERSRWEDTLFKDEDAVSESACGSQVTISPTVDMAAAVVASQIMSLMNGDGIVPFFQEFYTKHCSLKARM